MDRQNNNIFASNTVIIMGGMISDIRRKMRSLKIIRMLANGFYNMRITSSYLFKFRFGRASHLNHFYLYFDPSRSHPGLCDRIKTIVSCYYLAKENGYEFKLILKTPFDIGHFLQPNLVKWDAKEEDLEYSIRDTRFFLFDGKYKKLKTNKQYICVNYYDRPIEELKDNNQLWKELFNQLFVFSPELEKLYYASGYYNKEYVAIHLRFLNALGTFEKGDSPLPVKKQEQLIDRCRQAICKVFNNIDANYDVLVFSDSSSFLKKLHDLPVVIMDNGHISHISYTSNIDDIRKTFFDFMMISKARRVYRIVAPEMFSSNFPVVAAKVSGVQIIDMMA